MPQASDELRKKIYDYFGADKNGLDPYGPEGFLTENGWFTSHPFVYTTNKSKDQITDKEWDCLDFLVQEWDYGFDLGHLKE